MDQNNNETITPVVATKKEVIKHSSAIHVKNSIDLLQRRTWNVLLAYAFNELMEKREHRISVQELQKTLGFDSKNDKYLKQSIEGLCGCVVTWNLLGKDKKQEWGATSLLAHATIKKGCCSYAFSDLLKSKLFNPSMYTRISLSLQNRFTSKHALVLYELCLDYLNLESGIGETARIGIGVFRDLMGLDTDQYPAFKAFNQFVLKASIQEVNKISDLEIKVHFFKEVRKVVSLKFYIKKKNNFPRLLPAGNTTEEKIESLYALLKKKTATLKSVIAFTLTERGFDYVRSNILYANENVKKNYTLYLKNALKNDWASEKREESAFEAQKSQQEEEVGIIRYIKELAAKQASRGLPELLMNLDEEKQKILLKQAEARVMGSKFRDFLLRDENRDFLKQAIQGEAIKEMKG